MLRDLPVEDVTVATAIFLPSGGMIARAVESIAPNGLPWGSFIAVSGNIEHPHPSLQDPNYGRLGVNGYGNGCAS
jgi:hypothetical protein